MQNGREFVSVFIILDYYCVDTITEFSKAPIIRSPTVSIEQKEDIAPESTGLKKGNSFEEKKVNIKYPSIQHRTQEIPKPKPESKSKPEPKPEPKSKSISMPSKEAPKIKNPFEGCHIEFDDILDTVYINTDIKPPKHLIAPINHPKPAQKPSQVDPKDDLDDEPIL